MKFEEIGHICQGQDGAVWGDALFRMDADGSVRVFDLGRVGSSGTLPETARFVLDGAGILLPHCNAVSFGRHALPGDEFPLVYANVYNNYQDREDRREGETGVWRIWRQGGGFSSALVQIIRISFAENRGLWKSLGGRGDVRPYGNFVADRERQRLYAFVMRDREHVTRYFEFSLPEITDGSVDPASGVRTVALTPGDILNRFDGPYMDYMQGACARRGKLYSVEGFDVENGGAEPALRVIDMIGGREVLHASLPEFGLVREPEWIDFHGEELLYSDAGGALWRLTL